MRPILLPWNSVNHRAPSGPASITMGTAAGVGTRYSVIAPPRVMRPILLPACSVNQRAPSGPTAILSPEYSVNHSNRSGPVMTTFGLLLGVGTRYWLVTTPAVLMRATLLWDHSVYQIAPSGPAPRSQGARGTGYSASVPSVVMLPISELPPCSVNQSAPPGPLMMSQGSLAGVGSGNSVNNPRVVMRPILFPAISVNQSAPSGPATIQIGLLSGVGIRYSVMAPPVVMRPILFPCASVNQRAPSGPGMMAKGRLDLVGTLYSMITCAGTFADRLNSNAASNASSGIRGCLRVNGNIVLLEASTTGRPE